MLMFDHHPVSRADAGGSDNTSPSGSFAQGMVLVSCAWLAVMATSLIAPVLPAMSRHFADGHGDGSLVQLTVALPALMVAIFSSPAGLIADRIGRRNLLLGALVVYAILGLAPIWLDSLPGILLSRCLVGIAEAIVMTTGTALLGDYFSDGDRDRWFAIQTGTATLASVVLLAAGGTLGEVGWRTPFYAYLSPLVIAILTYGFIKEPQRQRRDAAKPEGFSCGPLAVPVAATFLTTLTFFVIVIQLPFLLTMRGFISPALIGCGSAAAAAAVPAGSLLFRLMERQGHPTKLVLSYGLNVAGFIVMALTHSYMGTVLGAMIAGMGSGIALPTLLTWATGVLSPEFRGRATGLWNSAFFLGQFLSPIVFLTASARFAPPGALVCFATLCGAACLAASLGALRGRPAPTA